VLVDGWQVYLVQLLRFQHDLDTPVFLVAECLIKFWPIFQRAVVSDDKGRVDLARFNLLQQWLEITLYVRLNPF
jgi:hypothetical protein